MIPKLAALRHAVSCRPPSNSRTQASNGLMVSGYFSGSISRSPRASGVTHPAQTLTRGKTAASSTSTRSPARASRHAAVLPPGPPPTTTTSKAVGSCRAGAAALTSSRPPQGEEEPGLLVERHAHALDLVGDGHDGEHVALEVEAPAHVGLGEVVGRGIPDQVEEDLRRLEHHCAERLVAGEPHLAAVPEPEGHGSHDVSEELAKDVRGAGRRGVRKEAGQHRWSLSGVVLAGTCRLVKSTGLAAPAHPRMVFMTSWFSKARAGRPSNMISPRSMAYRRSATREAVMRFDSAMRSDTPMALMRWAASMKRLTTTGASPSKGSSRRRTEGPRVRARAMATIFFCPPERKRPRRAVKVRTSGKSSKTRGSIPPPLCASLASAWLIWKFSATVRSGKIPASSGA